MNDMDASADADRAAHRTGVRPQPEEAIAALCRPHKQERDRIRMLGGGIFLCCLVAALLLCLVGILSDHDAVAGAAVGVVFVVFVAGYIGCSRKIRRSFAAQDAAVEAWSLREGEAIGREAVEALIRTEDGPAPASEDAPDELTALRTRAEQMVAEWRARLVPLLDQAGLPADARCRADVERFLAGVDQWVVSLGQPDGKPDHTRLLLELNLLVQSVATEVLVRQTGSAEVTCRSAALTEPESTPGDAPATPDTGPDSTPRTL
jgi:hypothetical protein